LIDRTIVERTAPRLGPVPLVRVAGDDVDNHAEVLMTHGNRRGTGRH
jgi:hypothetical protein